MTQIIPNIGETVRRETGMRDFVTQLRLGEEQSVLVWGVNKERFYVGDKWEPEDAVYIPADFNSVRTP